MERDDAPRDLVASVTEMLKRRGPLTPGAIAAGLPEKRRKMTRRVLELLKRDGLVVEAGGKYRLVTRTADRTRSQSKGARKSSSS